jgi:hypothetical protein
LLSEIWGRDFFEMIGHLDDYRPDLVAKKDNELFIVEVKSNGPHFHKFDQEERFYDLKNRGFNIMLIIVPIQITVEVTEGKPKIIET